MILVPCYAKDLKLGMHIQCNKAHKYCGRMLNTPNVFRTIENINDFSMPYDRVSISLGDTPENGLDFGYLDFFQEDVVVVMFDSRKEYDAFRHEQETKHAADDAFFDNPDDEGSDDDDELDDDDDAERQGQFAGQPKSTIKISVPQELKHRSEEIRLAVEEELMRTDNGGITSELLLKHDVEVQVEGN